MRYLSQEDLKAENLQQVKAIMQALRRGEPRKISFLGASVSKGEVVPKGTEFFSVLKENWQKTLQTKQMPELINVSKSGTLSSNAMFSMWELVEQKPDIVFLDYAVNDPGYWYLAETFESVVRHFLEQGCAVVVLLFSNHNGNSAKRVMTRIAHHYNVPAVNIGDLIHENIQEGHFTWNDFASDYVHPTIWGHQFIAENVLRFLELAEADEEDIQPYHLPEEYCYSGVFCKLKILDQIETCEENFSCLFVEYTQNPTPSQCSLDLYIDGEYVHTIHRYSDFSWDNRVADMVFQDEKNSRHHIEIKPAANAHFTEEELRELHIKLGMGSF